MSAASQALASTPILRPPTMLCRSLTLAGRQCNAHALRGQDLCVRHAKCRHLVLPRGPNITLPLLEDLESIQVFSTQMIQGLLTKAIDTRRAGKILYACQILASTMPRPPRLKPAKEQESPAEPVTEVFEGPDGELLGPIQDARTQATFSEYWSFDKYRYEQECERLGRPLPKTPADMPQSGWLNPEDLDRISHQRVAEGKFLLDDGYCGKMLELHLEADRLGKLPPIAERRCMYGKEPACAGPGPHGACYSPCKYCARERDEYLRLHPDAVLTPTAPSQPTDLKACAGRVAVLNDPGAPQLPDFGRWGMARSLSHRALGAPPLSAISSQTGWVRRRHLGRRANPRTPHVKSVTTAKPAPINQFPGHPSQGGTPVSRNSPRNRNAATGLISALRSKVARVRPAIEAGRSARARAEIPAGLYSGGAATIVRLPREGLRFPRRPAAGSKLEEATSN